MSQRVRPVKRLRKDLARGFNETAAFQDYLKVRYGSVARARSSYDEMDIHPVE